MYHENEGKHQDLREYARVSAYLPFSVSRVPPEEREYRLPRMSSEAILIDFAEPPEMEDKVLSQWFTLINMKLDSIISSLTFEREGFSSLVFRPLNISGSGMSFMSKENYRQGDYVEIKLMFHMHYNTAIYVYGDVVNVEQVGDESNVAVKFTRISEEVREEIVKFVFKRQREILSAKRG